MRLHTPTERGWIFADVVAHYVAAEVYDGATWRDLSNLGAGGLDFLNAIRWGESIDDAVASGSMTLARRDGGSSLAPLKTLSPLNNLTGSYAPLLHPARPFRIRTATVPLGTPPAGHWKWQFFGKLDRVSWGKDPIEVTFRDSGAFLLDYRMELERQYSGGALLPTVLQALIADYYPTLPDGTVVSLLTEGIGDVGWSPEAFQTKRGTQLWQFLRDFAAQIGWDVRCRFSPTTDAWGPTLYSPDRVKTVPDETYTTADYEEPDVLDLDDEDVVNVWAVDYMDSATGRPGRVVWSNAGSIQKFGRRFAQIDATQTLNIDSVDEADRMAAAAVTDTAEPFATFGVRHLYDWRTQLADLNRFLGAADHEHFDQDMNLAVASYQHEFPEGDKPPTTTKQLRGHPAGAYGLWIDKIGAGLDPRRGLPDVTYDLTAESTPFGGGAFDDGLGHLYVRMGKFANSVEVVASEAMTDPAPNPESAANRQATVLARPEGAVGKADEVELLYLIATMPAAYRKMRCVGVGATPDLRANPVTLQRKADDAGNPAPTAPTVLTVTPIAGGYHVAATATDAAAEHWVFRNGIGVKRFAPGAAIAWDDTDLPSQPFTYKVLAKKANRTSAFAQVGGTSGGGEVGGGGAGQSGTPNQLAAPVWYAGYPRGYPTWVNEPWAILAWTQPGQFQPGTAFDVYISSTDADAGYTLVETLTPSAPAEPYYATEWAPLSGITNVYRWVYVKARLAGYAAGESEHRRVLFQIKPPTSGTTPWNPGTMNPV